MTIAPSDRPSENLPPDEDLRDLLELYRVHRDEVGRVVGWLLGPGQDRGPAVAAVFSEAFRSLPSRRPSGDDRAGWMRALAVRAVRPYVRIAQRARGATDAARDDAWCRLYRVLDALPARLREVFVLHELAAFDGLQVAAALGLSPRATRARLARARRAVFARIARDPAFEPRAA